MYNEVFDRLESLFADDPTVEIERGDDYISFSQIFTNNVHVENYIPEAESSRFTHTVTINNGSYKTVDAIESKVLTPMGIKVQYKKGHFVQTGFILAPGLDLNTGQPGLVRQKWSTSTIKKPVKECLKEMGIKKAGLFG